MELAVLFVVYDRAVDETETARALRGMADAPKRICVYDNSDRDYGNRAKCEALGWHWLGGGGNVGLPKAYNAGIDALERDDFDGIVCIFDDDTDIAPDYFARLAETAERERERSLFFPILRAGERIASPQIIHPNQRAAFYATEADCLSSDGKDRFAFNSGMAVRMDVFRRVRYDERLFLDGVDYAFLRDCYASGLTAAVIPVTMAHGFSGAQRPDYPAALARFRHYAADFSVVLTDDPGGYRYLVGKRALHLVLIYKKLTFLRVFHARGQ